MLGISRLVIAIRSSDHFRLAVQRFVAHAPHSAESSAAWSIISQASCMQPYTSRKHVHEAALTLGMRMHQARLRLMERAV